MLLLPLLPEFLVFECEGKTCLSHLNSNTVIYAHNGGDYLPDDIDEDPEYDPCFFQIKDTVSPYLTEVILIELRSDRNKETLDLLLEKAAKWYIEYTALSAFKTQNDCLRKTATP